MESHWYFHSFCMYHNQQVNKTISNVRVSSRILYLNIVLSETFFWKSNPFTGQDPCFEGNHQDLGDIVKRSPSYTMDSLPLCDRYITETWYTTKNHVMPSSAPSLSYCGTLYPVWLRGKCFFFKFYFSLLIYASKIYIFIYIIRKYSIRWSDPKHDCLRSRVCSRLWKTVHDSCQEMLIFPGLQAQTTWCL